jgi:small-conductance mechanosensitive channel
MNIMEINTAILQGGWTNDQLSSMIDAVKFARARLTEQSKRSLSIGDNVNFTSSKLGRNVTGVVTKIAIKFVTVKTVQGAWRVPANMLTKIEDTEFA